MLYLLLYVLKHILDKHLEDKIPIVAVVAVMGTTEESPIDPLSESFNLQKSYSKKVNQLFLKCNTIEKRQAIINCCSFYYPTPSSFISRILP